MYLFVFKTKCELKCQNEVFFLISSEMFVLITENFWRIFWRSFWRRYLTPYKTPANDFKTFRYNFWMEFLILDHCEGVWLHCWWMDCQNQTMLSRRPSLGLFRGQETLCHIIFHNVFHFIIENYLLGTLLLIFTQLF